MDLPAQNTLPPLSDSAFYMLRCVVAVACADKVIKQQELIFLRALLSHFKSHMHVSAEQIAQLKQDLKVYQPIDSLLPHVTDREDREHLILFAGLLAQADGEVHPDEEAIIKKINAYCAFANAASGAAPAQPASSRAPLPAVVPAMPAIDMNAFMNEVRDVVRQEVYQQSLKTSGIEPKHTSRVAVIDAFAEKSRMVPHTTSYHVVDETPQLGRTMRESLIPDERVLGKARFHRIYAFDTIVITALLLYLAHPAETLFLKLCGGLAERLVSGSISWLGSDMTGKLFALLQNPWFIRAPIILFYLAAALYALARFARWLTTEIVVTDSRIIVKQGIFTVRTFKSDFTTLGQVDVTQSLLGNMLGYGSVHIFTRNWEGRGNAVEAEGIYLPPIADPHAFSTLIDRARRMWRTRSVQ